MQNKGIEKHKPTLPSARGIRRACNKELYRAVKKLKTWIPPQQIEEAEKVYFRKVVENLLWISEHKDNRKAQADWWVENVCPEIAPILGVTEEQLGRAFRDSFHPGPAQ